MTFLLDVNVLIALFDPDHLYHNASHRWLATIGTAAWATCPVTENGFARILGNPNYPDSPGSPIAALIKLRQFTKDSNHVFWPNDISLLATDLLDPQVPFSSKQLTDVYLLAIAKSRLGKFATFDRRINAAAVIGGKEALHLIDPSPTPPPP